jgi:protein-disulfide isomerase
MLIPLMLCATGLAAQSHPAAPPKKSSGQTAANSSSSSPIEKKLEAYLRKIYAWGPSFRVKVGPPKDSVVPGFYEVAVEISKGEQSDSVAVYVSKDSRYLLRGDLQDMIADPFAAVRSQIHLANNPSKGPANARVAVVEYADFQCPSCRQLHQTLRAIAPSYPQVRFVFKDYPLTQIHPWAMTAAIAGRCAYMQKPEAFWSLHDLIFDNQDLISPENVWQKMLDLAAQAGLDPDAVRACMAAQQAPAAIQADMQEAQALKIANTPTVFVNGRRLVGGERAFLEQFIQYELAIQPHPAPTTQ